MGETYFSKFPTILYNNTLTRNISERVKLTARTRNLPTSFYPFELKNKLRLDHVADSYYDDPTMDWMIYLTNGITDPYYDVYLYEEDFIAYIVKKYGSVDAAQEKISHYATNWADDPINMTVAGYTAATPDIQKYYVPIFGNYNKVLSYTRRKEDWKANTNKVVELAVANSNTYTINEVVDIKLSGEVVGGGEIVYISNTSVTIHHVSGFQNANSYLVGETSEANNIITERTVLYTVIPEAEFVFWSSVSKYDNEVNENEAKRYINLLDSGYAFQVAEEIRKALQK